MLFVGILDNDTSRKGEIAKSLEAAIGVIGNAGEMRVENGISVNAAGRGENLPKDLQNVQGESRRYLAMFLHQTNWDLWNGIAKLSCFTETLVFRYTASGGSPTNLRTREYHIQRAVREQGLLPAECVRLLRWAMEGAHDDTLPDDLYSNPRFEYMYSLLHLGRAYQMVFAESARRDGDWEQRRRDMMSPKWWLETLHEKEGKEVIAHVVHEWERIPVDGPPDALKAAAAELFATGSVTLETVTKLSGLIETRLNAYARIS